MTRPLRIDFPAALYHGTSRGDRREPIFVDDADRLAFLEVLALGCESFEADVHAYRALTGAAEAPPCLGGGLAHALLLGRAPVTAADWRAAAGAYAAWVDTGRDTPLWATGLRQQIYLGDERFVERMQARAEARRPAADEVPRAQRSTVRPLAHWLTTSPTREEAVLRAHREGGLAMAAIGRELGLSGARVSQLVARAEGAPMSGRGAHDGGPGPQRPAYTSLTARTSPAGSEASWRAWWGAASPAA